MFSYNNVVILSLGVLGGNIFTVDPAPVTSKTNVTITVIDSTGLTKTATVEVTPRFTNISINPSEICITVDDSATFYILGGTGGSLTITSGTSTVTFTDSYSSGVTMLKCPAYTTQFGVNTVSQTTLP